MTSRTSRGKVVGTLRVHYRGFGFLEPDDGSPSLFVPGPRLSGFLDGDRVQARTRAADDNASQLQLLERPRTVVVGDVTLSGGKATLVVDAALGRLTLPLDGAAPGAQCVLARMEGGRAVVLEDLGDPLSDAALERRVLVRHELPSGHRDDVVADARRIAEGAARPLGGRRDLTAQYVITIDDDHSQDLDDALAAADAGNGTVRVWIHIADVAEHVAPDCAVDAAARQTPTSVYLPTGVRHMLPPELAASRLSLIPQEDRDALTVELLIDAEGRISSVDVYESRIRSRRRVNYATVAEVIAAGESPLVDAQTRELLARLWSAACRLGLARAARGGVDAFRSDPEPAGARGSDDAHLLVERLMVAANEAVADWLVQRQMPGLYRVHPALSVEETQELEAAVRALGLHANLPQPVTPRAMAALAAAASRSDRVDAFWDAVLRLLSRASYQAAPGMHFGLGSERYTHFTSPLRRYADLTVHRVVKSFLAGEREYPQDGMADLAAHITAVSRAASNAERDMTRAVALRELRPRHVVDATVLSVSDRGCRVKAAGVIATLPTTTLAVGDVVRVRVRTADALTGRFEVAATDAPPARAKGKTPSAAAGKRQEQPTESPSASSRRSGRRGGRRGAGAAVESPVAAVPASTGPGSPAPAAAQDAPSRRRARRSRTRGAA